MHAHFPLEARQDALRALVAEEFRQELVARGWDGIGTNWLSHRDRRERSAAVDGLRREQEARLAAMGLEAQRYTFLSREQSLECEAIERDYAARKAALPGHTNSPEAAVHSVAQLRSEQSVALRSVLGDRAYLQYRLANSQRLQSYAASLAFFEPTAAELSSLLDLQAANFPASKAPENLEVPDAQIRQILGTERFEAYHVAKETRVFSARKLAADAGLPDTDANWILSTHDQYNQALGAIPNVQRVEKTRLFSEFEQTMRARLGDEGYRQYSRSLGYGMSTHLPWRGR